MTAFAGVPCAKCGEQRDSLMHVPLAECERVKAGLECREPEAHHVYEPDSQSLEAVAVELADRLSVLLSGPSDSDNDARWVTKDYQLVESPVDVDPGERAAWFLTPKQIAEGKARRALARASALGITLPAGEASDG